MRVTVGRIGRAHGIRGDVVVGVRTDEPELRFAAGAKLDTDPGGAGPLTVTAARWHSGELLVRFAGVKDRTAAEGLRGTWLTVDADALPPPSDPDEFRDHDLVGLSVRTVTGVLVGEVTDILHHGQDILVIRPAPASGVASSGASGASGVASGGAAASGGAGASGAAGTGGVRAGGPSASGGASRPGGGSGAGGGAGASDAAGADILVPFVKAIVTDVDVAGGTVTIDPPPGLLDLGETV
jgi:16S rRNA processing protein RimM